MSEIGIHSFENRVTKDEEIRSVIEKRLHGPIAGGIENENAEPFIAADSIVSRSSRDVVSNEFPDSAN